MSKYSFTQKAVMIGVLILILGTSTFGVVQTIGKSKWKNHSHGWEKNYYAVYNAPPTIITRIDSVEIPYPVYIEVPKPVYYEKPKTEDEEVAKTCTSKYSIPVKFTHEGLTWRFLATPDIKDCIIEDMAISDLIVPKIYTLETKPRDTCIEKPTDTKKQRAFQFGLFGGLNINNFSRVPGIDANIFLLYKTRWGFYTGGSYMNPNKKLQTAINNTEINQPTWVDNLYWRVGMLIMF